MQGQVAAPQADALLALRQAAILLANVEADPAQTAQMLADWEAEYGLPDPCSPLNQTIEQRHASLLAKIASLGGQSAAYYTAVAAALGYAITITTFTPSRLGVMTLGSAPLLWPGWAYVWQVSSTGVGETYFTLGVSVLGEPFAAYSGTELTCRLNAIKPAHTIFVVTTGP